MISTPTSGRRPGGTGFASKRQTVDGAPREPWSPQALAAADTENTPGPAPFMHARELVELAAIVSAHGAVLIRGTRRLSSSGVQQYWTESKCRLDRWFRSLRTFAHEAATAGSDGGRGQWPFIRSVLEEIITGEMLTRVWATVLCACDRQQGTLEAEPIARSIMIGHLEARHRVLMLLVRGPGVDAEAAVRLNHLRRRTERWTDLLVGYLAELDATAEFAFEPSRAQDFARDLRFQSSRPGGRHAWPLVLSSLRAGYRQGLSAVSPNADLNARIATAILACFPPELFDSPGQFRSLWLLRLLGSRCALLGVRGGGCRVRIHLTPIRVKGWRRVCLV